MIEFLRWLISPIDLHRRVEVMFPIQDESLRSRIRGEILSAYLADNLKARVLRRDGSYTRVLRSAQRRGKADAGFSAQDFLIALAEGKANLDGIPHIENRAKPVRKPRRVLLKK